MTSMAPTEAEMSEDRADAEAGMTLTLRAYAPNGMTEDADGYDVLAFTDRGTCRGKFAAGRLSGSDTPTRYLTIGGVERPVLEAGLHISIDAVEPKPGRQRGIGWEYVVEAAESPADQSLIGRRVLVVEVPVKSFATARRLSVVELSGDDSSSSSSS